MAIPIPTSKEFNAWRKKAEANRRQGKPYSKFKDKATGHTWYLDPKNERGKPLRFSPKSKEVKREENGVNGKTRRAAVNGKTLTLDDYIEFAKRNLYVDPVRVATEIFNEAQKQLNGVRNDKQPNTVYGHPSPVSSPIKGGLEHHRNVARQDPKPNGKHLDRIPSTKAHQEAGIPLTKNGAIRADMRQLPVVSPQKRLAIILDDLDNNVRPTARAFRQKLAGLLIKLESKNGGIRTTGMSPLEQLRLLNSSATGIAKATNDRLLEDAGTYGRLYVPIAD